MKAATLIVGFESVAVKQCPPVERRGGGGERRGGEEGRGGGGGEEREGRKERRGIGRGKVTHSKAHCTYLHTTYAESKLLHYL